MEFKNLAETSPRAVKLLATLSILVTGFSGSTVNGQTPDGRSMPASSEVTPMDPYHKAVADYVDAASREVSATRAEVDAKVKQLPSEQKGKYRALYDKLDKCDKLVAKLKDPAQNDFDKTKTKYEKERADLQKEWADARKS